jgi:protein arginine N-methyltransferase 2
MSDLHELCYFRSRPITKELYLNPLKGYLKAGIPATYTIEEAYNYEHGIEEEPASNTTPMHLICENVPKDLNNDEEIVVLDMMENLWLSGAGWCLINDKNETPACILLRRGLHGTKYWESCVDSGVRAEILLRKLNDPNVEFLDDPEDNDVELEENFEIPELVKEELQEEESTTKTSAVDELQEMYNGPAGTIDTYLKTELEYKDNALVTKEGSDGVMMQWEDQLMKAGCESLFKSIEDPKDINIVNIGFGMGIIDTMIQAKNPTKHYICEAHPDVLKKMKEDGWYEKPNVVILEGKWQDTLPSLLTKGIFFDGIYYDTFSEHYEDMVEDLFDLIVGLLKPTGTFSFFNGLGADRLVCYEVYKKVVDIDLSNYGLAVNFTEIGAPVTTFKENDSSDDSVWKDIKRAYWRCPVYYHPEARFM